MKHLKVQVVAASVDSQADAQEMRDKESLSFPVAYGLQTREFAAQTGAFFEGEKNYLQPAGFLLDPTGLVITAVYSTGAIGRLTASDVLGTVAHL